MMITNVIKQILVRVTLVIIIVFSSEVSDFVQDALLLRFARIVAGRASCFSPDRAWTSSLKRSFLKRASR